MTPLIILSKEEIHVFESPPRFTASERKYFFSIPEWAEQVFQRLTTPVSRIGFILQLGHFRATGKFYSKDLFYPEDCEFVQKRLGFATDWEAAQYSDRMMQRHRTLLLTNLGYRAFSQEAAGILTVEAKRAIEKQLRLKDVFGTLLEALERTRIETPRYSTLAAIITAVFRRHEKDLLRRLKTHLSEADKQLLDTLLAADAGVYAGREAVSLKRPRATLLKKFYQSTKPAKIYANIIDLLFIKELFVRFEPLCQGLALSRQVIEHYALIMLKVQNFQIERRNEKRYLYLLCFIVHQYAVLQDMLIDTLVRVSQSAVNKAQKAQREKYFADREEHRKVTVELVDAVESAEKTVEAVKRIVFTTEVSDQEKILRLRALLRRGANATPSRTRELVSRQRKEQKRASFDADYFDAFESQSLWLQHRAAEIIKRLGFNEDTSQKKIMAAIRFYQQSSGKLSEGAPLAFLTEKERRAVGAAKRGFRVSLYKALLFKHAAEATKSGTLNLKHSYLHRSLGEYMIDPALWKQNREEFLKRSGLAQFADFPVVMQQLREVVETQYEVTNRHILDGSNQYLTVRTSHDFTLTTPRLAEEPEPEIELFPQTSFVTLCEVLATMNAHTHFLDAFQPVQLTHMHKRPPDKVFFALIIALGRNLGIPKMARISKHISQSELERAALLYATPENVANASDKTLLFLDRLPLTHIFDRKDGIRHACADGQKITVGVDCLIARRSYKYFGKEQGITTYLSRDNRDFLYHSTVFSPTDREAWYAIDCLMHNTIVKPDWFSTDTHGVTPLTFAAMHFLGVFFAPRIADMQKRSRVAFTKRRHYQELGYVILPDKTVNEAVIQEVWDDILRFMATIILKETPPHSFFRNSIPAPTSIRYIRGLENSGRLLKRFLCSGTWMKSIFASSGKRNSTN